MSPTSSVFSILVLSSDSDIQSQFKHALKNASVTAAKFASTLPKDVTRRTFDAVIVDIPDFHHAPAMLTALKYNKHMYGQKPLVHQLDEVRMMKEALAAKPNLIKPFHSRTISNGRWEIL